RGVGVLLDIGVLDARCELVGRESGRGIAYHSLVFVQLVLDQERVIPHEIRRSYLTFGVHGGFQYSVRDDLRSNRSYSHHQPPTKGADRTNAIEKQNNNTKIVRAPGL